MANSVPMTIGMHVRLKTRDANCHVSYAVDAETASYREPMDGLILSIRDVKSGKMVKEATGEPSRYVFEVLVDQTFNPRYASTRNAARGIDRATNMPGWRRLRAALIDAAAKDELYTTQQPALLTESPLAKLLDGWKVVKVWSDDLSSLEQADSTDAG